ncbi:SsrA-binding protein SmpB [bacterium]|nr:SsrA-binding protein SmpB [bacterium]
MSLVANKKARFDYEVLETFHAGIELLGLEVKSLRAGRGSLEGARVIVRGSEAYLVGATIPPYQANNLAGGMVGYEGDRTRRLLLTKKEISGLSGGASQKGLTIIPLSYYNSKNGKIKLEIAVVRGKKKYDKREVARKKDSERDIARAVKESIVR